MAARLPDTLRRHLEQGLPFVAYRKPGQEVLSVLFQADNACHRVVDFTEHGFVFAPFDPQAQPVILKPDSSMELRFPAGTEAPVDYVAMPAAEGGEDYMDLVVAAQNYMARHQCRKVVVSRSEVFETEATPVGAFERLLKLYPDAFCYLWYHPETGIWTGASPELLLKVGEDVYQTTSLAGTVRYDGNPDPQWGIKEKEEQEIVTAFLVEAIKGRVATVNVTGPITIKAGDLLHLQSRISGKLGQARLAGLVRALHPSPAVCGLPRQEALEFINRHEGYKRSYYTGYLGEINWPPASADGGNQQAQLYVNLRCMSLSPGKAVLYMGGGVTRASSAASEWEETVNKSGTMLRVLLNSPQ